MHRIIEAKAMAGYRLLVHFDDGVAGEVDLSDLAGRGVFEIWNDRKQFEDVAIGSAGEVMWGDQADLCADALYRRMMPSPDSEHARLSHAGD